MVQMKPEEGYDLQITGYNQYGFKINNNITVIGPIVIFPKTIFSWNIADSNEINEKSLLLFTKLEPKVGNYNNSKTILIVTLYLSMTSWLLSMIAKVSFCSY
jgi:hypothetical protein